MPLCHPAILLHRAKADLTLLDENRNTALHLACSKVPPPQHLLKSRHGGGVLIYHRRNESFLNICTSLFCTVGS